MGLGSIGLLQARFFENISKTVRVIVKEVG